VVLLLCGGTITAIYANAVGPEERDIAARIVDLSRSPA
jgi:hypothetical protein